MKKSPHDLASYQEKVFEIDSHMGCVISGMTADARYLTKFMRNECMNYTYAHGSMHPCERLVAKIGKKAQVKTAHPSKRPFGVGMLIGAVDEAGSHIFESCPSGNFYEYHANAIGDRNQSAKTYLEKNFENFAPLGRDEMIRHGIEALKCSAQDTELTEHNVSLGVVSLDEPFNMLSAEALRVLLGGNAGGDVEMVQMQ